LDRLDEADAAFAAVAARKIEGQLPEAALYRQAEIRETRKDFAGAAALYDRLLERNVASPQIALVKLGAAASAAGDPARAIEAHRRVLREFTLTAEAAEAEALLDRLGGFLLETPEAVSAELGRADALFKARKRDQARRAFERVRERVEGDSSDRVILRLAQIEAENGQHRAARDVFRRYVNHETLGAEARYGVVAAALALDEDNEFRQLTEDFVVRHPTHPLAEQALNELARHYVLDDEDGKAAAVYTRLIERFPSGAFAERATWKAGWWAYREKNFQETIRVFERGAATFPRSDYRPSWLYWSARSYDHLGDRAAATDRYRLTATDYLNTYYGRLAWRQLEQRSEATVTPGVRRALVTPPDPPPTAATIAKLIEAGLYRPALNELQFAQKVWGDSAPLQATIGLVHNKMGNLRLGINAMKRAYPQFMAAGGEALPLEILRIIYPLDYWPLLKGNAQAHGLDPYIIAALAAQESTFDARIRSSANAIGLMQIIPSTGRRYARKLGMRRFSERSLENPEINARLGTQYFADLVNRFGGHHHALASYNAGEHRVARWNDEAPGLPQDEWIDNIPFPETQNYVKRILGTAEDYRQLYGDGQVPTVVARPTPKAPAKKSTTAKTPTKKKTTTTKKKPTVRRPPVKKKR
jgi:soluble lytic murein transglycosylase